VCAHEYMRSKAHMHAPMHAHKNGIIWMCLLLKKKIYITCYLKRMVHAHTGTNVFIDTNQCVAKVVPL